MKFEVELKFRLNDFDVVEGRLREMKAVPGSVRIQVDRYFNHPSRDFRSTDEAFRIRSVGADNFVTYKGAVVGSTAKTRHEIEVGIEPGVDAADRLNEMVRLLGFRFVRDVRKSRTSWSLNWSGREYELALDDVPGLGRFLEIELIAEGDARDDAESAVWSLASALGLSISEPRSYLDLLLESDGSLR